MKLIEPFLGLSDAARAHLALRLVLGVNIAAHGLVRVAHAGDFARQMSAGFAPTLLPAPVAASFLAALPFAELAVGAAIVAGLWLRGALFAGSLLIAALTFGMSLQQQWEVVGLQLVYALVYWVLLSRAGEARLTVGGGR